MPRGFQRRQKPNWQQRPRPVPPRPFRQSEVPGRKGRRGVPIFPKTPPAAPPAEPGREEPQKEEKKEKEKEEEEPSGRSSGD